MLDLLNRIDWDKADHVLEFLCDQLAFPAKRSAVEARETGNNSLDTIPLVLEAMKEKERHSTTRMVLSDALHEMTRDYPERRFDHYCSAYHQILLDDLKELRVGCRDWYATIVCELSFQENAKAESEGSRDNPASHPIGKFFFSIALESKPIFLIGF